MKRKSLLQLLVAVGIGVLWSGLTVQAQDFQRTYRLAPNGSIAIQNVSGDIIVTGHDGEGVIVRGTKEGPDADKVDVQDKSTDSRIDLRVLYQQCRNCSINASVNFQVQVPRSSRYRLGKLNTASGNIEVSGVNGEVHVSTASGDLLIKDVSGEVKAATASGTVRVREVAGTVNASSASGDVDVEITRLEGTESMNFSSASGDINVKMPSNLDAEVEMSTVSGSVKTNFPIEVKREEHSGGASARGRVGSGSRLLRISSASGNVSLTNP
ncbi:MAG TPA: DUF4097 family beta strand repeat-containing protein [Pyrinomonadaceae bacterium]|jgi:DUF4097 and DUF4098 domain-containing protein YvlB